MPDPSITEAIFIADTAADLERATEILDAHGIVFVTRRVASDLDGGSRQGLAFYVLHRQAAFCREVLAEHGLSRGVVFAGVEEPAAVTTW